MSDKVLITGADGQLGHELQRAAPSTLSATALSRSGLDITDAGAIADCLARYRPVALVNAAAYTAVDRAESEEAQANAVNATGPGLLAAACRERGVRLIHVSTDFVFDGSACHPYAPDAPPAPLGAYGRSKLAGERAVLDALEDALIVRTGWVYSAHGTNFVRTMLRLMAERDELAVVADQVGTPTWAAGLAQALWRAVSLPALRGIYHWSDAGVCSWYDFAVAIEEEGRSLGLLDRRTAVRPIAAVDYPTPARRPAFSVLDKQSSWRDLALTQVHWREQLRRMLAELKDQDHG